MNQIKKRGLTKDMNVDISLFFNVTVSYIIMDAENKIEVSLQNLLNTSRYLIHNLFFYFEKVRVCSNLNSSNLILKRFLIEDWAYAV